MTAKRFEINKDMNLDNKVETYELSCLVYNSNKTFYFIVDSIANVESFVERLNELHKENQKLQNELETYKSGNVVLKKTLDKYEKVMRKYELDSVEKLDQVLREQRVW